MIVVREKVSKLSVLVKHDSHASRSSILSKQYTTWLSLTLKFDQFISPSLHCEAGWWHKRHDAKFPELVFHETCSNQGFNISRLSRYGLETNGNKTKIKDCSGEYNICLWMTILKLLHHKKVEFQFGQYD